MRNAIGVTLFAWAILACGAVPVEVEPDLVFDPDRYSTYHVDDVALDTGDPALAPVRHEVERTMQALDLHPASEDRRDLLIKYLVNSESEVRLVNAADPDSDYAVPKRFTRDTVVIEIVDVRERRTVWRGSARTDTMAGGALIPESRSRSLTRAARSILAKLPKKQP